MSLYVSSRDAHFKILVSNREYSALDHFYNNNCCNHTLVYCHHYMKWLKKTLFVWRAIINVIDAMMEIIIAQVPSNLKFRIPYWHISFLLSEIWKILHIQSPVFVLRFHSNQRRNYSLTNIQKDFPSQNCIVII